MKPRLVTAEIEAAEQETPDAARPGGAKPDRRYMVALRGRVIHNPDNSTSPRFALRKIDGTTIALDGVYSDEDGWLVGAKVDVEGWFVSESVLSVRKLVVRAD